MIDVENQSLEHIARILRADKDDVLKAVSRFETVTGKQDIVPRLAAENTTRIDNCLSALGLARAAAAHDIYAALISKMEADDYRLRGVFGEPAVTSPTDVERVLTRLREAVHVPAGLYLKREKAAEFLRSAPPPHLLAYLGYSSADTLIEREDLFETYSALRFMEDRTWMNETFLPQYASLTPDDFEEREVAVRVLDPKWNKEAETFLHKKWHNISHLKELGVVFVIPAALGIPGEFMRMVSLILHYLYEVPFYAELVRQGVGIPELFAERIISLLAGDVIDRRMESEKSLWLVVQRYLAKDDPYDWRLAVPHLSPEARHWAKAEEALVTLGGDEMRFWRGLGWVGDYFKSDGGETLVSFNLVDTVMSLVKQKELVKYLYHHQEALWNRLFTAYFGEKGLEHFLKEYLLTGYFEI